MLKTLRLLVNGTIRHLAAVGNGSRDPPIEKYNGRCHEIPDNIIGGASEVYPHLNAISLYTIITSSADLPIPLGY